MKNRKFLLISILVCASLFAFASQTRKVLIIGWDGVRSDALQQANTPNLDALIAEGLFTYDAWHLGITVSGPSWSTIMTGVWWNKHGVFSNAYTGSNYNDYPYFPTRAKELRPNLKCVQVTEWAPMSDNVYNDGWDLKLKTPDGDGAATEAVAVQQLQDPDLDALFVYFDAVDLAGHSSGFDPNNPSYMQAIENNDFHTGNIITALKNRPTYNDENWLVLLITDHGGRGTGHGGISYEERHIWWVASGNAVQHGQIYADDPGTYNLLGTGIFNANGVDTALLNLSPVQADIAVTALHHLIFDTGQNPENIGPWGFDGKSWLNTFIDSTTGTNKVFDASENIKLYPNPTTGIVTVWFENSDSQPVEVRLFDIAGRVVKVVTEQQTSNKINIDLSEQPVGQYIAQITIGKQTLTRKIELRR